MGFWAPLVLWLTTHLIRPDLLVKGRRREVEYLRDKGNGLLGHGVFRDHIAGSDWLHGFSVCQSLTSGVTGGYERATCRACIRIAKRAGVWPAAHQQDGDHR